MNLPNKLTVTRILMIPLFVFFFLCEPCAHSYLITLTLFSLAAATDFLDGYLARKNHQITNFGKFLDPMADKLLVLCAMICLLICNLCSPIVLMIVLAREFLVSSLRLVAASQSVVIAAGFSGKVKTVVQLISIIAILFFLSLRQSFGVNIEISIISNWLMWLSAGIAVYSGIEYLVINRRMIDIYQ